MISLGSRLIACCKLAPSLARQMWRHNYVIDRNECLIFTLSESINPWVYSLQFLFKSTNNSWRYEGKKKWVFFSEHSVQGHITYIKLYWTIIMVHHKAFCRPQSYLLLSVYISKPGVLLVVILWINSVALCLHLFTSFDDYHPLHDGSKQHQQRTPNWIKPNTCICYKKTNTSAVT